MSLQVWLPLNGNINDQGLANRSWLNTGVSYITINNSGKIGKCYNFKGVGYLSSESNITLHAVTYTAWVKWDASATSIKGIVNNFSHTGSTGYNISFCLNSNGMLRFDLPIKKRNVSCRVLWHLNRSIWCMDACCAIF